MKINKIEDYFRAVIYSVNSRFYDDKNKRLNKSEIDFLVACALYHYEGGDLNDLESLYDFVNRVKPMSKNYFSVIRTKISTKKFIMTSRNSLVLPSAILHRKGDKIETKIEYEHIEQ